MRIYAQHGYGEGEKINEGISLGILDGVIYSPKDISLERLNSKLQELEARKVDRLFDPQFYLCTIACDGTSRLGNLLEDYGEYFGARRRSELENEETVLRDLEAALRFQGGLKVDKIIAPNVLIPKSCDSVMAAVSRSFIRNVRGVYSKLKDKRPVYATLAISRDALTDRNELNEFLNDILICKERPDGFYLLVATKNTEARSDIFNADIVAAWMYMNHALKINGFDVINGYSDLMTPFLGAAGGSAGATGWWSNLRQFAQDRFAAAEGGGRQPVLRYLSTRLLNRIACYELDILRKKIPSVLNNLGQDASFSDTRGSEPEQRASEVLQSWEAIKKIQISVLGADQITSLKNCKRMLIDATAAYEEIEAIGIPLDPKSNAEHIESLSEGVKLFEKLAEINIPED